MYVSRRSEIYAWNKFGKLIWSYHTDTTECDLVRDAVLACFVARYAFRPEREAHGWVGKLKLAWSYRTDTVECELVRGAGAMFVVCSIVGNTRPWREYPCWNP